MRRFNSYTHLCRYSSCSYTFVTGGASHGAGAKAAPGASGEGGQDGVDRVSQ